MSDWDDDFDIDSYLANEEKREEIEKLHQLGKDCELEYQYAKAEKFYQRAAELANAYAMFKVLNKKCGLIWALRYFNCAESFSFTNCC